MLYEILKSLIGKNAFEKEDMTNKLNVFYTFNQLSVKEYAELIGEVDPTKKEESQETEVTQ
ncbi:hypothetical protein CF088_10680 [Clostridium botulinum]|uniref:hypothetical protein n=1 Tax=Clostridium botulinum TaxID=1491 RepID=UPI00035BA3B7|nr:hypothetical protein [Clostridium botulinum]EPS56715.1 hypothetical protein CLQ_01501 [Clostridium botulinum Af84]MBN3351698.1 hypothetical protein [Clostridium botulinum]MBN3360484.1 hypothetical protein [Clostridium botulinum]MBN3405744.1 hypothetical protein [Clostridium botulinum]NFM83698.1 hypothetical protein [Clostridium botulinum]